MSARGTDRQPSPREGARRLGSPRCRHWLRVVANLTLEYPPPCTPITGSVTYTSEERWVPPVAGGLCSTCRGVDVYVHVRKVVHILVQGRARALCDSQAAHRWSAFRRRDCALTQSSPTISRVRHTPTLCSGQPLPGRLVSGLVMSAAVRR